MFLFLQECDEKDFITTIHVLFEDSENHKNEPIAAAIFQFYWLLLLFYETIEFLKVRPEHFFYWLFCKGMQTRFKYLVFILQKKNGHFFGAFVVQWMISFAY